MSDRKANKKTISSSQALTLKTRELEALRRMVDEMENNLEDLKKVLFAQGYYKKAQGLKQHNGRIVEGVFDGESMIAKDAKKYQVPANYASKSKLVPGDILKLIISENGDFIFKQIGPVERKKLIAKLVMKDENKYQVHAEGKNYNVLLASVTYYKAKPGDKITITVPKDGESDWAAIENLIVTE